MSRTDAGATDYIDRAVAAVAQTWPDHDPLPFAVVARMARTVAILYSELETTLADSGLSRPDLEALAHLRASGPANELSQRQLARAMARTAGTLSVRVDRLEAAGLVTRRPNPADLRGVQVRLTRRGKRIVDRLIPMRLATDARLLSALSRPEQLELIELLRKLLRAIEAQEESPHQLGIALQSRRLARTGRGPSRVANSTGVAVADVEPGSPAAGAGVSPGDILVRARGERLRSLAQFRRLVSDLAAEDTLELTLIRDGEERRIVIHGAGATWDSQASDIRWV